MFWFHFHPYNWVCWLDLVAEWLSFCGEIPRAPRCWLISHSARYMNHLVDWLPDSSLSLPRVYSKNRVQDGASNSCNQWTAMVSQGTLAASSRTPGWSLSGSTSSCFGSAGPPLRSARVSWDTARVAMGPLGWPMVQIGRGTSIRNSTHGAGPKPSKTAILQGKSTWLPTYTCPAPLFDLRTLIYLYIYHISNIIQ